MGLLSGHQPGDAPVLPEPGTGAFGGGALGSISACLPGLKLFSFVSVCVFARLWDISSHQPGWLDRCNLLSCLVQSSQGLLRELYHMPMQFLL